MAASKERRAFLNILKAEETEGTKLCTSCDTIFPDSEFHKDKNARKGLASHCKKCNCKRSSEYGTSERGRASRIARIYGLTVDQFDMMLESQKNRCKICGSKEAHGRWGTFVVDHCHISGDVRGLLCNKCNTLLGMADDNVETLRSAISYLEENK